MKHLKISIILLSLLSIVSCSDFLSTQPSNGVSSANMWSSPELAKKGMNGLYETFYNRKMHKGSQLRWEGLDGLNKYGIEAMGFCTDYFSNNFPVTLLSLQAKHANDLQIWYEWEFGYNMIHACNDAIANLNKAGLDESTYQAYLCEAKFLRAWAYSRLNKIYDGVPIYTVPISNEECIKTQSTPEEVWNLVIEDLTFCTDNESFPNNSITSNLMRPSKGAAYALRGMAYMWMARNDESYYAKAAADFSKVSECGYKLWNGKYIDLFTVENEHNPEIIFSIQYSEEEGYCDNLQQALGARDTYNGWTEVKPSADFVDYYQNADGTEFKWEDYLDGWNELTPKQRCVFFARNGLKSDDQLSGQKAQVLALCGNTVFDQYYLDSGNEERIRKAYENRDPRLKQTVVTPYEPITCYSPNLNEGENMVGKQLRWPLFKQGTDGGDFWLDKRTSAYYAYKKYVLFLKEDNLLHMRRCQVDFPLIRFTDIQLLHAEALIHLGQTGEAADLINEVRTRAGMPAIAVGSEEEMIEALRYERRVEFPIEGINYFDEVRWGTLKQMKFQGKDVHGGQSWWGDDTVEYPWYWHDCLWPWPAPYSETVMNTNLTKREGWIY